MAYNTRQLRGVTGKSFIPGYADENEAKASQLYSMIAARDNRQFLEDEKTYRDRSLELQQEALRQSQEVNAQNEEDSKWGKIIQGGTAVIAGYNAVDDALDGGVTEAIKSIPETFSADTVAKTTTDAVSETLPGGFNLAGVDQAGAPDTDTGGIWGGVKDIASDYVVDPAVDGLKKLGSVIETGYDTFTGWFS